LLKDQGNSDEIPLYLINLGDEIIHGGFSQASELVNWEHYNQQPQGFAERRANEAFYAPEGANVVFPNEEDHLWSEDENEWLNGLFGREIIEESTKEDLQYTQLAVILSRQRRRQRINQQLLNQPTLVAIKLRIESRIESIKEGSITGCTVTQPVAPTSRHSQRQRRPKRHFDEVE